MAKVETEFPDTLRQAMAELVKAGWYADEGDLVREAVRRFLETHAGELMAQFIREDITWGLSGSD